MYITSRNLHWHTVCFAAVFFQQQPFTAASDCFLLSRIDYCSAFCSVSHVLTLAMCSIGLLSKRFTEALDALDFRAYYALSDMGVPLFLRIRYAVVPQLLPAFISAVLYRFDVNIREASVLGLVGAGGIGAPLIFAMNQYSWHEAGAIFLGLILLVLLIDRFSAKLRAHLQ